MKLTLSDILGWLTEILFGVGAVSGALRFWFHLVQGSGSAAINALLVAVISTGIVVVVTPKTRQWIKERYEVEFSRWLIVVIVLGGFLVISSLNSTGASDGPMEGPESTVETYFTEWFSSDPDYEMMYEMRHTNESFDEWRYEGEVGNVQSLQNAGGSFEYIGMHNVTVREDTATVYVDAEIMGPRSISPTPAERRVELVRIDEEWLIDEIE